jgi:hypothetical protein
VRPRFVTFFESQATVESVSSKGPAKYFLMDRRISLCTRLCVTTRYCDHNSLSLSLSLNLSPVFKGEVHVKVGRTNADKVIDKVEQATRQHPTLAFLDLLRAKVKVMRRQSKRANAFATIPLTSIF